MFSFIFIICVAILVGYLSYEESNKKYEEYFEELYDDDWED